MPDVDVTVTATGPLFRLGSAPLVKAMNGAIRELVQLGEQRLNEVLRPRPAGVFLSVTEAKKGKASVGHYRRNIHSRMQHLAGVILDGQDRGVLYGPWLEGVGSRNQTTRFKGYFSFRKTADWLNKPQQKGRIIQAHIQKAVRELNA